ncbi:hypothetical protein CEXT_39891 [Caerostris extrusa]|uniref:Uncharacterized protein n=1 Tax=Caerostris extrusa TaxID=172846 RepID=A0AAV4SUB5_CAEEX|nr:hypothetical protein CEXT_39891 [Caerostris extrusa]
MSSPDMRREFWGPKAFIFNVADRNEIPMAVTLHILPTFRILENISDRFLSSDSGTNTISDLGVHSEEKGSIRGIQGYRQSIWKSSKITNRTQIAPKISIQRSESGNDPCGYVIPAIENNELRTLV